MLFGSSSFSRMTELIAQASSTQPSASSELEQRKALSNERWSVLGKHTKQAPTGSKLTDREGNMSTLHIHMKSGNVLKLKGIKDWSLKCNGDQITSLKIVRSRWANFMGYPRLIVQSIDLKQIEAVVESGYTKEIMYIKAPSARREDC